MPIMNPKPRPDDLPEHVRAAFAGRGVLPLKDVAGLIGMSSTTLRRLIRQHRISSKHNGVGRVRRRHVFAIDDVAGLWHTMSSGPVVGPTGAHHDEKVLSLRQKRSAARR